MLSNLYTEEITIKTTTGNQSDGFTSTSKTINGAIFQKTRRNIQKDGTIIMTNNVLNTLEDFDIAKTLINYSGKDRNATDKTRVFNHFTGKIDHWEYNF